MEQDVFKTLYQEIIEEKIATAIFDASGNLKEKNKNLSAFLWNAETHISLGQNIYDLFPELIGYEKRLNSLHEKDAEDLLIERVYRSALRGKEGYVDLQIKAYEAGWIVILEDVTARGVLEQQIVQQRNELDLLASQLLKTRMKLDKLFRTFVPPSVVDELMQMDTVKLGGERRVVTILFGDLRGYTSWAEERSPEEALEALNNALSEAAQVLHRYGTTINQLMGDGFMSIFNAPLEQPDHPYLALQCAQEIAALPGLSKTVRFGVGVNTGYAMVGNVGAITAMDYSAIGTTTNLAFRIQGLAGPGVALFSESTRELIGERLSYEAIGSFSVKGIAKEITPYKLLP